MNKFILFCDLLTWLIILVLAFADLDIIVITLLVLQTFIVFYDLFKLNE